MNVSFSILERVRPPLAISAAVFFCYLMISYKSKYFSDWKHFQWQGFYSKLKEVFIDGQWDYVANRSGGFMGFWWHFKTGYINNLNFTYYIQLEEQDLVIKIQSKKEANRKEVRDKFRTIVLETAKDHKINLSKFGRIGYSMGVAKLDDSYIKEGTNTMLEFAETIHEMKKIELLMNDIEKKVKSP